MNTRTLRFASLSLCVFALACGDDGGTDPDGSTPMEDATVPMEDATMPEDAAMPDEDMGPEEDMGPVEDMGMVDPDMGMAEDMGTSDACVPMTCEDLGAECGAIDDGCGTTLDCGGDLTCVATEGANGICNTGTNECECTVNTCGASDCGTIDDGCGGTVDCGTDCSAVGSAATCNTATNMCECTANTCEGLGAECGSVDDGCGTTLDCGGDATCVAAEGANGTCNTGTNLCECVANTCGAGDCGTIDDGCGGTVDCGTDCSGLGANGTCNTTTNMCECTPDVCAAASCGMPDDGCGTALDCGTCTGLGEACNGTTFTCEVTAPAPTAGQVLFNEFMYDPGTPLTDADAEWLELVNATAMPLNLDGCILADAAGSQTLTGLVIPANGFIVLASSLDMASNGLPTMPDALLERALNNGGDTLTLTCGGTPIDMLMYDGGPTWPDANAASVSRDPSATAMADSNDPANWCFGSTAYFDAGGAGEHLGTPGSANPGCPATLPGFCRTQFPDTLSLVPGESDTVYGRVYAMGITDATTGTDVDPDLVAELGYGPRGTDASSAAGWTWQAATANTGYDGTAAGEPNNDEYQSDLVAPPTPGDWDYVYRFSVDGGSSFLYCNTGGPGTSDATPYAPGNNGMLTIAPFGTDDITTIRGASPGTIDVDVDLVYVTYIKPAVGGDPAGFFVQAETAGPAIFVEVDPSGLSVGDGITFTATELTTVDAHQRVTAITGLTTVTTGFDVDAIRQDLSSATDLVSALGDYESELLAITGDLTGAFTFAGTDHSGAVMETTGVTGDTDLRLRLPDTVVASTGVRQGCNVTVEGAMWRFDTTAQPSGWVEADLTINSCPAPVVASAVATNANTVVVTFDVPVDAASVMGDGSQFTFDNGLTASAASASGNQVTLTTSAQAGGTTYTVTVASSVTDDFGTGVGTPNTAMFSGFAGAPVLLFTEYYENGNDKAVEVTNIGGTADLATCQLHRYSNGGTTLASSGDLTSAPTLATGASYVFCGSSPPTIGASCDEIASVLSFNGDDVVELWCDLGTGLELMDRFGDVGIDPGSSWPDATTAPGCSTTPGTESITISRLCTVTTGRTANTGFCPADEWEQTDSGMALTVADLGSYTCP